MMKKELSSRTYKTAKPFTNNEIFKKELELVMVTRELQVTYSYDEKRQMERFNIATALLKADDGKYYKIQVQNDRSDIDDYKNERQYVVKEVDSLDIREIGGWEGRNFHRNKIVAIYEYFRPMGKGNHKVKISKGEGNTIVIGDYGEIDMTNNSVWVNNYGKLTTKIAGHKMKVADLEKMADDRGLRRGYLRTFTL